MLLQSCFDPASIWMLSYWSTILYNARDGTNFNLIAILFWSDLNMNVVLLSSPFYFIPLLSCIKKTCNQIQYNCNLILSTSNWISFTLAWGWTFTLAQGATMWKSSLIIRFQFVLQRITKHVARVNPMIRLVFLQRLLGRQMPIFCCKLCHLALQ